MRFAVRADPEVLRTWPVAYHGTSITKAARIMVEGLKRPSKEEEISHGQAYSQTRQSIYASPSVEYAAFPVYAPFTIMEHGRWMQAVMQLCVRPGCFAMYPASLRGKYWPEDLRFDPNFETLDNLEWLIEDEADVVVTGVLLREFGPGIHVQEFYG